MLATALGTVLTASPIYYHTQNWFCHQTGGSWIIPDVPFGNCWTSNGRFWLLMIGLQVLFFLVIFGISIAKTKYYQRNKAQNNEDKTALLM
jgi:hypothetical protein